MITREQLLDNNRHNFIQNPYRKAQADDHFFLLGAEGDSEEMRFENGLKQYKRDFLERQWKTKGKYKLGLDKKYHDDNKMIWEELKNLFGEDDARHIILGISQDPSKLATALAFGFNTSNDLLNMDVNIKNAVSVDIDINLERDQETGKICLYCTYDRFGVEDGKGVHLGFLAGPTVEIWELSQNEEKRWGFSLVTFTSKNEFIFRLGIGEVIAEEDLKKYLKDKVADEVFLSSAIVVSDSRHENSDPTKQFDRDVEMTKAAIAQPGKNETAIILKKIYTLLYFGELFYKRDHQWHLWRENEKNNIMPIASSICHGSRVLVQFPAELSDEIIKWLFADDKYRYTRFAATHGCKWSTSPEKVGDGNKVLSEIKVSPQWALWDALCGLAQYYGVNAAILQHYGVNIALGGVGGNNIISGNVISDNGEHGHLYICHSFPAPGAGVKENKHALLIGIEQSAPLSNGDQYGGTHSMMGAHLNYSATGGDDFGKRPPNVSDDYVGLQNHGPDAYYDSLYIDLDPAKFQLIQQQVDQFSPEWLGKPGERLTIPPQLALVNYNSQFIKMQRKNKELNDDLINCLNQIDKLEEKNKNLNQDNRVQQENVNKLMVDNLNITSQLETLRKEHEQLQQTAANNNKVLMDEIQTLETQIVALQQLTQVPDTNANKEKGAPGSSESKPTSDDPIKISKKGKEPEKEPTTSDHEELMNRLHLLQLQIATLSEQMTHKPKLSDKGFSSSQNKDKPITSQKINRKKRKNIKHAILLDLGDEELQINYQLFKLNGIKDIVLFGAKPRKESPETIARIKRLKKSGFKIHDFRVAGPTFSIENYFDTDFLTKYLPRGLIFASRFENMPELTKKNADIGFPLTVVNTHQPDENVGKAIQNHLNTFADIDNIIEGIDNEIKRLRGFSLFKISSEAKIRAYELLKETILMPNVNPEKYEGNTLNEIIDNWLRDKTKFCNHADDKVSIQEVINQRRSLLFNSPLVKSQEFINTLKTKYGNVPIRDITGPKPKI